MNMSPELEKLEQLLSSPNKAARLKALKLMLLHPQASPLQIVRCLCSEDNRDFEFLEVFELDSAMRASRKRIHGVDDDNVYVYLESICQSDPERNGPWAAHVLAHIGTSRAAEVLSRIRENSPEASRRYFNTPRTYAWLRERKTDQ